MGRFCASVLLLLGACGDNVVVDPESLPGDGTQPGENGSVVARYEPQVCGVVSWDPSVAINPAQDVSVAARPGGGATLLGAPLSGGALTGFVTNERMDMQGDSITKVAASNAAFDKVTVAYMQDRPVTTAVADGAVYVHMLDENLGSPQYIAKLPGTATAEGTFFKAQGNIVMPVATSTGLWMHRFVDDSLEPSDSKLFAASKPVVSLTTAQFGTNMMTAWTTETECHLMVNTTFEPGVHTMVNRPCPSPRLSLNESTGDAVLLFDSAEGIRLMPIHITMFGGDAKVIRSDASSPRTLFDGQRFWVSYLDARGDVVVGFLDKDLHPRTLSLGAPKPERAAYEFVMIDGRPTIFSVEDTGYTAYSMCVDTIE